MRRMRITCFFSLLAILSGLSVPSHADDIELYLARAKESTILNRPNLLFMFASSNSMLYQLRYPEGELDSSGNNIQGQKTGVTRLGALQEALVTVLNQVQNVNIGFGRFTFSGANVNAPIVYPVKYIDEAVAVTGGTVTVGPVAVSAGADDVEEADDGSITVDAGDAELVYTSGGGGSFTQTVSADSNNAHEDSRDTTIPGTGAVLPVGVTSAGSKSITTGVRFTGVDIPSGVTVNSAKINFTSASSSQTTAVGVTIAKSTDSSAFTAGNNTDNISGRATSGSVAWTVPSLTATGTTVSTPDISSLFTSLVGAGPTDVVIVLAHSTGSGQRSFGSNGSGNPPSLSIGWSTSGGTSYNQKVAVRFQDLDIPRGVTVSSAKIRFTASGNQSGNANITVSAEDANTSTVLNGTDSEVSNLSKTSASVNWQMVDGTDNWTDGNTYDTADLTTVVQEVVDRSGWCGGNSMTFILEATDPVNESPLRKFVTQDGGSAPELTLSYDSSTATSGSCSVQYRRMSIIEAVDDAEETLTRSGTADNTMWLYSSNLEMTETTSGGGSDDGGSATRIVGLRYQAVPIPQGTTVVSAELDFKATASRSGDGVLEVFGQNSSSAQRFSSTASNLSNTSTRPRTSAKTVLDLSDTANEWTNGSRYRVDVTDVVQEIVNRSDWESYNNMAFLIQEASGAPLREALAFDASTGATDSTVLHLTIQGYFGDESGTGITDSVRAYLQQVVREFRANGEQVIVDALYEAGLYYRGDEIQLGKARNNQVYNRVSHADAWDSATGTLIYGGGAQTAADVGCDVSTYPYDDACSAESISDATGEKATYISPIVDGSCAQNHIILLSDGNPTKNTAAGDIGSFTDDRNTDSTGSAVALSCATQAGTHLTRALTQNEKCGPEWAEFLYKYPQGLDSSGTIIADSNIKTHTIGFALGTGWQTTNASDTDDGDLVLSSGVGAEDTSKTTDNTNAKDYLRLLAKKGGGGFYEAENADDLANAILSIIDSVLSDSASFVSPTLSASAFNRFEYNTELYFSVFQPAHTNRWSGNVKKYEACSGGGANCSDGDIVDKDGYPILYSGVSFATNTESDNQDAIHDKVIELWNTETITYEEPDGTSSTKDSATSVCIGCDGNEVEAAGAGAQVPAPADREGKVFTNLSSFGAAGAWVDLQGDSSNHILDPDNTVNSTLTSFLSTEMLVPSDQQTSLIKWILGYDVDDEDQDGDITDARWNFGDSLHSQPVVITYGKDSGSGDVISKLLVASNDGSIRMLRTDTGVEEWAFIPQDMLKIQDDLRANARFNSGERIYGIDGTPVVVILDVDGDGYIEPGPSGDLVKVFIGMRRGGRNIYALDLTPGTQMTSVNDVVYPKLMWTIRGGVGDYAKLGQTWSAPKPVVMPFSGYDADLGRFVLMFGGGFDNTTQDVTATRNVATMGNGIYIVDPASGERLLWISGAGSGADLALTGMDYSIPSDLTVIDGNRDGLGDRIYVGDTGGQLWRIDLADVAADDRGNSVGGMLANTVAVDGNNPKEMRRFFYPPDVASVGSDVSGLSNASRYDAVAITSGYRPDPTDTTIKDRLYIFRDRAVDGLVDSGDGNASKDASGWLTPFNSGDLQTSHDTAEDGDTSATEAQDETYMTNFTTITHAYMYDATDDVIQWGSDTQIDAAEGEIKPALGWYIDLFNSNTDTTGEKGLSKPIILNGKVFFTTFVPQVDAHSNSCISLSGGKSRLYVVDIFSGKAVTDFDDTTDDSKIDMSGYTHANRFIEAGGEGISSGLSIFDDKLLYSAPGGPTVPPVDIQFFNNRIYWIEE